MKQQRMKQQRMKQQRMKQQASHFVHHHHRLLLLLCLFLLVSFSTSLHHPPPNDFHIGRRWMKEGRHSEAMEAFKRAEKEAPSFPGTHMGMGMVHVATGDFRSAASNFLAAATLDPSDTSAWKNAATSLSDSGEDGERATKCYRKAFVLRLVKELRGVSCEKETGSDNRGYWRVATRFEDGVSGVISSESLSTSSSFSSSTLIPRLWFMEHIHLIGTLMVHLPSCTVYTGRHQHFRTIPLGLGRSLRNALQEKKERELEIQNNNSEEEKGEEEDVITWFSLLQSTSSFNLYHWMSESVVRLSLWLEWREGLPYTQRVSTNLLVDGSPLVQQTLALLGLVLKEDDESLELKEEKKSGVSVVYLDQLHSDNNFDSSVSNSIRLQRVQWLDWQPMEERTKDGTLASTVENVQVSWDLSTMSMMERRRPPTHVYYAPKLALSRAALFFGARIQLKCDEAADVKTKATTQRRRLLWVSRRYAKTRYVTNEESVWWPANARRGPAKTAAEAATAATAAPFWSVHDGTEPLGRQIDMFHAADVIVGSHGAGMTLLMFAAPSTRILMFPLRSEAVHRNGYYHHLAAAVSIDAFDSPTILLIDRLKNLTLNASQLRYVKRFVRGPSSGIQDRTTVGGGEHVVHVTNKVPLVDSDLWRAYTSYMLLLMTFMYIVFT